MKWKAPEGYLSIKQAAEILDCSEKTVRNRLKNGEFTDCKMVSSPWGDAWVISENEVGVVKEVLDVVKVSNEFEVKDLVMGIRQIFDEREDQLKNEINELKKMVNGLQGQLAERDRQSEERDKQLLETIRELQQQQKDKEEKKKGFFARLFGN